MGLGALATHPRPYTHARRLITPERRSALRGTSVRLRVTEAGDLADLLVGVTGSDQAEGAALGGLQGGEALCGGTGRARRREPVCPRRSRGRRSPARKALADRGVRARRRRGPPLPSEGLARRRSGAPGARDCSYLCSYPTNSSFVIEVQLAVFLAPKWGSGRRVSNPRPRAWEARALPAELRPRRVIVEPNAALLLGDRRNVCNRRTFFSAHFCQLQRPIEGGQDGPRQALPALRGPSVDPPHQEAWIGVSDLLSNPEQDRLEAQIGGSRRSAASRAGQPPQSARCPLDLDASRCDGAAPMQPLVRHCLRQSAKSSGARPLSGVQ